MEISAAEASSGQIKKLFSTDELSLYQNTQDLVWINFGSFTSTDSLDSLEKIFGIHPLTIEDIFSEKQQPKLENFENYSFFTAKTIRREKKFHHDQYRKRKASDRSEIDEFIIDQLSIIIMKNMLFSFYSAPNELLQDIQKKFFNDAAASKKINTDYLAYTIIDSVVDEYFLTLNHLEEDIENLEDRAGKTNDEKLIGEIQDTKSYLMLIRRAVSPLRLLLVHQKPGVTHTEELEPFFRDLNDHLSNAMQTIEHYNEWLSDIMNVNLSVISNQTNKVMKVLATISTIFIPLTFIAGVYGMNFEHMPELDKPFAYPIVLLAMSLIALTMFIAFKIRRWF